MKFYVVWSLLIPGLKVTVAANTTQNPDLNTTSIVKNRRDGPLMPPRGGPHNGGMPPDGGPGMPPNGGPGMPPNGGPGMPPNGEPGMPPGGGPGMPPGGPGPGDMPHGGPMPPGGPPGNDDTPRSGVGHVNDVVKEAARRFTVPTMTTRKFQRTTPRRVSFKEDCDYLAHYCLKAYDTGVLCGRTIYFQYFTFKNYCLLDYVNCMERYEIWQVVHMGECFKVKELTEYVEYPYEDDFFLDQYYIVEDL